MAKTDNRTSKAEMEKRIQQIVRLITEGNSKYTVIRSIAKEYGVKEAFAYKMYKRALERIKEAYKDDTEHLTELMLADLQYIYRLAIKQGNLQAALKAKKQIAELTGIDAPKKTDANIALNGLENISDEQLAAIIASGQNLANQGSNGVGKP